MDFVWRRTEMHSLLEQIRRSKGPTQSVLMRSGVALLYAHWEGFTKLTLTSYLRHVARRKLRLQDLQPDLASLAVEYEIRKRGLSESKRRAAVVKLLLTESDLRAQIPSREVNTQSNLNYEVYRDLFESLGLDHSPFDTKSGLIDYKLLRSRNEIAHGRWLAIDPIAYEELHHEVLDLMNIVRVAVVGAVDNMWYKRSA